MKHQELSQFMKTHNWGQKQVAQHFEKSITTISQYLNGKYNGDVGELDRKTEELIALHKEKINEAKYKTQFVRTMASKRGMDVMRYAHADGDINVIYGAAGLGKTQMLKQYAKENSSAVLIETDPSCTAKVLLRKICEAVGANARGNNNELLEAIVSKLRDSGRLILVDEAELLSTRSLEFLRRIHDLTNVGVVLAGMPRLIVNLRGKNNELAQLYSRVGFACDLGSELDEEDLGLLASETLGTDEFNAPLIKACKGNARRLSKLMRGVVRASQINDRPIDEALINQFAKMLIN
ncbi:AAA family ATPase [Phocoenobacter skyensis]|uniref:AAA family ATPase n=1 Tax=Phocoenobacter skyensis TaxID=97481 RepID=A0ABT9JKT8_9PAST|nr:AAA family ATPase [Pasteurella skyensis]MDP8079547.1 AAA family ATPase [Pasteurella skyensis]MDP8085419.1 AAA family ATPase [Pasteurella skyensis]